MAKPSIFTAQNDGFTGTLCALTLKVKYVPNNKGNDNVPDSRLHAGG